MKVRIPAYTVHVDDEHRRVMNRYYGREGLADREEIQRWFTDFGRDGGWSKISDSLYYESTDMKEGSA